MKIDILTLFPDMLRPMLGESILGRAIASGCLTVNLTNIRDYAANKHKNTDDYPFGGGAGMVMYAQPVCDAVRAVDPDHHARRIYLSPRGRTLTQRVVEELGREEALLLLCGHYEGVDQRALDLCIDEELSIGDYVLTGGELGALVVVDAVSRMLPGVLGCAESGEDESFTTGLLEYPQYTRPAQYEGLRVPDVLIGGNHADIEAWRRRESLALTRSRRPELLETAPLTDKDRAVLGEMQRADAILATLSAQGVRAERLSMFEERDYRKAWLRRFVPNRHRAEAKRVCLSGRRHVGFLDQAFQKGFVTASDRPAPAQWPSGAILWCDREGLGFRIENPEALTALPPHALLTDPDMTKTITERDSGISIEE